MAKKVIKYEAKDGTLFDKWDDALDHDRGTIVRRWFRYVLPPGALSSDAAYDAVVEHFDLTPKPAFYRAMKNIEMLRQEAASGLLAADNDRGE